MSTEPTIKTLRPHQLGWLKRPELCSEHQDVWELPDGSLIAVPAGKEPVLEFLKGGPCHSVDR